jgi:hypothetical protein
LGFGLTVGFDAAGNEYSLSRVANFRINWLKKYVPIETLII